jgi:lipoyl(octanoyl) transferase
MPYAAALELQRDVARRRIAGEINEDVLVLVEHPPVVTLGRTAKGANLVASPEFLASRGVELFEVERGGDITFHGPGQLVGYPIIDLKRHRKDLHWYLRKVEEALIQGVAELGIVAGRVEKYTGVWVTSQRLDETAPDAEIGQTPSPITSSGSALGPRQPSLASDGPRKLASIGVHARDWVTWHGFALNVNTDLGYFDLIVPCGIPDVTMTSVAQELGEGSVTMHVVRDAVVRAFGQVFDLTVRAIDPSQLAGAGRIPAEAVAGAVGSSFH